jgi:hypothetical protein
VDEDRAGLGRPLARAGDAAVDRVAAELNGPAEAAHGGDLGERGLGRHEDLAREPAGAGGIRERLRVVAGRARDDRGRHGGRRAGLGAARRGDPVDLGERAAQLERAGPLQVLRLQQHAPAALVGQAPRRQDGRVADEVARALACVAHRLDAEPALQRAGPGGHEN